jgi:hypothetical protein
MKKVLVCIPIKPSLHPSLHSLCLTGVGLLPKNNPALVVDAFLDYSPVEKLSTDSRPWSRVARARNRLMEKVNWKAYDYLLWIDADVVKYPLDMPTKLIEANPDGVSAPLVLIQDSIEFYDWAAFVMKGKSHILPADRHRVWGRNLQHKFPYWNECHPPHIEDDRNANAIWANPPDRVVEMDCVGTITMVPTWVYLRGARYEDHPAFTDHFPICQECVKHGHKVVVVRDLIAKHANLPKFKESWH